MTATLDEPRLHAYCLPSVKDFTTEIQLALKPAHFRRTKGQFGMSYEYASYLLHAHAGYVQPRSIDGPALDDLARTLAKRREGVAA